MNDELKNTKKRKNIPLTKSEWLTFFFLPFIDNGSLLNTNTFNETEEERFKKYGFDKKLRQSEDARGYGSAFYIILFLIVVILINI